MFSSSFFFDQEFSFAYLFVVVRDSEKWTELEELFKLSGGDASHIVEAFDIEDPRRLEAFSSHRKDLEAKHLSSPSIFLNADFNTASDPEVRVKYRRLLTKKLNAYAGSRKEGMTPILPMVHGTTEGIAWKIAQSGFGTAGTRDAGYYGAGIYFTSRVSYATSYSSAESQVAVVVIALVNPGNFYPTTESPKDPEKGFMGKKCKGGYQSHYTVVGDGKYPSDIVTDTSHDELVVFQDAQALPKYIVRLGAEKLREEEGGPPRAS